MENREHTIELQKAKFWISKIDIAELIEFKYHQYKGHKMLFDKDILFIYRSENPISEQSQSEERKGLELKEDFCDNCRQKQNFLNGYCEVCGDPDMANSFQPQQSQSLLYEAVGAVKLSKAQKEVITRLQANEIIHYMNGLDAKCFYSNGGKTISWATIFKLENYGLVERTNKRIELAEQGRSYCC